MYDRNNFIIGTGSPIYNMLFILKKKCYLYISTLDNLSPNHFFRNDFFIKN